ncbi:hypothetical protein [Streptomyces parvus]|uniref:hypothetical protein n=1 Tax=Streptomyces parvus TaxID=66428 RepID=UPI003807B6BB
MGQVPDGYHRVRAHIRRNPTGKGSKRMSAWLIAGLIAGVWLWGQVFGFDEAASAPPITPQPSVSATAGR